MARSTLAALIRCRSTSPLPLALARHLRQLDVAAARHLQALQLGRGDADGRRLALAPAEVEAIALDRPHHQRIAAHEGFDLVEQLALARQFHLLAALGTHHDIIRTGQFDGAEGLHAALRDRDRRRFGVAGLGGKQAGGKGEEGGLEDGFHVRVVMVSFGDWTLRQVPAPRIRKPTNARKRRPECISRG
jgi:hypothetical protein